MNENDTRYHAPTTLDDALTLLARHRDELTLIAGGTDLTPQLNAGRRPPRVLMHIGGLGLNRIEKRGAALWVGAATPWRDLERSDLVRAHAPALARAARDGSTDPVKTLATVGGNLATASPAADLPLPLLAMDAAVMLLSARGERIVALKDFFRGPGQTELAPDEIIRDIRIPTCRGNAVFLRLGGRRAMSCALVNVAVRLDLNAGRCAGARIALGAVAPTPMRCLEAEALLRDRPLDARLIHEAAHLALAEAQPIDDGRASAWYRRNAGRALVCRALEQACGLDVTPEALP